MPSLIQVKRSTTTAIPASLANGEIAVTSNGDILYIGSNSEVLPVGGRRVPGVLTANQALVANSTSGIDKIIAANVTVLQSITANGTTGTASQVLTSGGPGQNSYWSTISGSASAGGTNTQVQFNDSSVLNGSVGFTFDKTANNLTVANTVSSALLNVSVSANVGANVQLTTSQLTIGNTTANLFANSIILRVINSTSSANLTPIGLVSGTSSVNSTVISAGANATINLTSFSILGNTTSAPTTILSGTGLLSGNSSVTGAPQITTANSLGNTVISTTSTVISNSTVAVMTSNLSGIYHTGTVNAFSHTVGAAFSANSTVITFTGANVDATSALLRIRDINITGNLIVTGTVTAVDTTTLAVRDNVIQLADAQANTTTFTDTVDTGIYTATGNTSVAFYSGLARIAASSSNTNPYFRLYSTTISPNNTNLDTGATTGTLQSFLVPYGIGGAFVVNSTAMALTANSTVSLSLTANTLSLSTPLPTTSGGSGLNSYTAGDILVGNTSNVLTRLSVGTDGRVLQISGTSVVWGTLDGGTF